MIQGFSSPKSFLEVQLPWMGGWGKFPSSSPHPFFRLFQAPLHPPSSLCSTSLLPSLMLSTNVCPTWQCCVGGRISTLPPGSVCFLKVMIHCRKKKQSLKHAQIMIWSTFLCALKVSDYIGNATVCACLCAVNSIAVDWQGGAHYL